MKVFLDDVRVTPDGWVRTFWPEEVIALLKTGEVTELSLDHDLGDDEHGTGYTVLLWLEEQVAVHGMTPPAIRVHSANSAARLKMQAAIAAINRHADQRGVA
ncbi:cyclic-phosphate processing receiver domain-containing protein [Achromobacter sp. DH1f]|uniref:cyclic-phosphate processing receiver domain-containing protein n=1 Tax=Achromobacter sp. DH1f TaxID=1397275 RepID=UPI00046A2233|nr:cyclic-phosphate processing receiver domain-containing protein [Achromobacter sp. DH1f]